jgi:hypothetical protein
MANVLVDRMVRAAKLDWRLYEEVEADDSAMGQAVGVVVLSAVAAGIGSGEGSIEGVVFVAVAALVGWYIWAYLTYWIGTRILPGPETSSSPGELLRTLGFASSPGIVRILGVIPGAAQIVFLVAAIWMLIAMIIAVRSALDYTSNWRALGVCAIGWVIQALALAIVFSILNSFEH